MSAAARVASGASELATADASDPLYDDMIWFEVMPVMLVIR